MQRLWVGFLFWRSIATVILKSKWTVVCRGYLPGHSVLCLMSSPEFNIHVSYGLAAVKNLSYTVSSLGSKWHFAAVLDLVACDVYEEAVRKVPLDRVPWASSRLWPYKSRSYTWTMCFQLAVSLSDSSLARTTAANYFGHYRSYSSATCIMPCSRVPQLWPQERCWVPCTVPACPPAQEGEMRFAKAWAKLAPRCNTTRVKDKSILEDGKLSRWNTYPLEFQLKSSPGC